MNTYKYNDNTKKKFISGKWEYHIIFVCEADDILKADEMFKFAMGNDPAKLKHISCQVESNESNESENG